MNGWFISHGTPNVMRQNHRWVGFDSDDPGPTPSGDYLLDDIWCTSDCRYIYKYGTQNTETHGTQFYNPSGAYEVWLEDLEFEPDEAIHLGGMDVVMRRCKDVISWIPEEFTGWEDTDIALDVNGTYTNVGKTSSKYGLSGHLNFTILDLGDDTEMEEIYSRLPSIYEELFDTVYDGFNSRYTDRVYDIYTDYPYQVKLKNSDFILDTANNGWVTHVGNYNIKGKNVEDGGFGNGAYSSSMYSYVAPASHCISGLVSDGWLGFYPIINMMDKNWGFDAYYFLAPDLSDRSWCGFRCIFSWGHHWIILFRWYFSAMDIEKGY